MSNSGNKTIYYINRFDLYKRRKKRKHSGYERITMYHPSFKRVDVGKFISKVIAKCHRKYPKNYLPLNFSKELLIAAKALVTGQPVFYLYADKDAYFIPKLKRKFKLKRLKIYGTLHWPISESQEFSFYKHNLSQQFNGIIGLSNSILELKHPNTKIIQHGIDLEYWSSIKNITIQNTYLLVGISNRNHAKQLDIINKISRRDPNAKFVILCRDKAMKEFYSENKQVTFLGDFIEDDKLKELYSTSKAVILFQNYCLASNVVLESIAMSVPLIANNVGDISEYLGADYPLFIDDASEASKLDDICFSEAFHREVQSYLNTKRNDFGWNKLVNETIDFIV